MKRKTRLVVSLNDGLKLLKRKLHGIACLIVANSAIS